MPDFRRRSHSSRPAMSRRTPPTGSSSSRPPRPGGGSRRRTRCRVDLDEGAGSSRCCLAQAASTRACEKGSVQGAGSPSVGDRGVEARRGSARAGPGRVGASSRRAATRPQPTLAGYTRRSGSGGTRIRRRMLGADGRSVHRLSAGSRPAPSGKRGPVSRGLRWRLAPDPDRRLLVRLAERVVVEAALQQADTVLRGCSPRTTPG